MTGKLVTEILEQMAQVTLSKSAEIGMANAKTNLPYIKHIIAELSPPSADQAPNVAMVMAAGPSLHRQEPA